MRLASRVGALLALLAVPLLLALASQSLAARPGAPAVPTDAVRLGDRASGPGVTTPEDTATPTSSPPPPRESTAAGPAPTASASPSAPAAPAPPASAPAPAPPAGPAAPRVVVPAPERTEVDDDDAQEQDDDD